MPGGDESLELLVSEPLVVSDTRCETSGFAVAYERGAWKGSRVLLVRNKMSSLSLISDHLEEVEREWLDFLIFI